MASFDDPDALLDGGSQSSAFHNYLRNLLKFEHFLAQQFEKLGRFCARRPRLVQFGSLLLTFLISLGLLNAHFETQPAKLWSLVGSPIQGQMKYIDDTWGSATRTILTYQQSRSGSVCPTDDGGTAYYADLVAQGKMPLMQDCLGTSDVLNSDFLDKAAVMHRDMEKVTTQDGVKFSDVCYKLPDVYTELDVKVKPASSPCFVYSPLEFWPLPFTNADIDSLLCVDNDEFDNNQFLQQMLQLPNVDTGGMAVVARTLLKSMSPKLADFRSCATLLADAKGTLKCESKLGVEVGNQDLFKRLLGANTPQGVDQDITVKELCPKTCKVCNATDMGSSFSVSASSLGGLQADSRVKRATERAIEVLSTMCQDLPPTVIETLTRHRLHNCAEVVQLLGGSLSVCSKNMADIMPPGSLGGYMPTLDGRVADLCPLTCKPVLNTCADAGGARLPPSPPATPDGNREVPLLSFNMAFAITGWNEQELLGRVTHGPKGAVLGATGVRSVYILDCPGRGRPQEDCMHLESEWMKFLLKRRDQPTMGDVYTSTYSQQGQYEETLAAIASAGPLFLYSMVLMILYIVVSLGKRGAHAKHSKVLVGLVGTSSVVLSTIIAFAVCSMFSIPITPISQIVPFLLLGIGIDNVFILIRSLERVPVALSTEERVGIALRNCGGSITVTALTDALAFVVGATIRFPAMRAFCVACALGICACFFMTITYITACLAVQDRSMKGEGSSIINSSIYRLRRTSTVPDPEQDVKEPSDAIRDALQGYWRPFVMHSTRREQYALMTLFGCLVALAIGETFNMEMSFDPLSMFIKSSYIAEAYITGEQQFELVYYPWQMVMKTGTKYWDPAVQQQIFEVKAELQASPYITANITDWLAAFMDSSFYTNSSLQGEQFVLKVHEFVESSQGLQYAAAIKFDAGNNGSIVASELQGYFPSTITSSEEQSAAVRDVRAITAKSPLDCFIFALPMILWEVWDKLIGQMMLNLGETFLAIFFVTNIFLFHPITSVIILVNVLAVEFELMAACAIMHIPLNTVTMCIFVMNFGLVFDYSAHIAHMFMTSSGTKRERAARAVTDMGSGVFSGAFTTFIGFLPLFWAQFGTGKVFAQLFGLIITLGIIHGFAVLPIMLCLWGPEPLDDAGGGHHNNSGLRVDSADLATDVENILAEEGRASGVSRSTAVLKEGTLRKLGGKDKDKWQQNTFSLSGVGLAWETRMGKKQLKFDDIGRVAAWSDIGISHAFEIVTKAKGGKVYKFSAADDAARDAWLEAIEAAHHPARGGARTKGVQLEMQSIGGGAPLDYAAPAGPPPAGEGAPPEPDDE